MNGEMLHPILKDRLSIVYSVVRFDLQSNDWESESDECNDLGMLFVHICFCHQHYNVVLV